MIFYILRNYHCFYYTKDDEYGHVCEWEHEIAFFNNKDDAEEYKKDFESNARRLGSYTHYSSKIITVNEKIIY